MPDFNAVRMTRFVQRNVGRLHLLRDPGARLVGAGNMPAGGDDRFKVMVSCRVKLLAAYDPLQILGNVESVGLQDEAWVGSPPDDGLII